MVSTVVVRPASRVEGRLAVPGDKSISHRAAMLAAVAEGDSEIEGFLRSEDCLNTLAAMETLGARCVWRGASVSVTGTGGEFTAPTAPLDMGNSGTGLRLLCGLLAAQPFSAELTGDASLRSRPMRRVQEPLVRMGAKVDLLGRDGRPPVRIAGAALEGIEYTMPVASAQVKSCALLAGLFARGVTSVVEPRPTRDHTERMLGAMGAPIEVDGARVTIRGAGGRSAGLRGRTWRVPGDFSSAAFWLGAAAARSGRTVTVTGVGLNPRRTAFLDVLTRMGAAVSVRATGTDETCEPVGDVTVTGSELAGTTIAGDEVPNLIDELPLVAVLAATARGETTIRDASELRYKESDRVATVAEGLRAVGADARELPDGMTVRGRERVRGDATVNSRGDHRIAMSFAVLALGADAPVAIRDTACVATSYPGFWDDLRRLT